MSKHDGLIVADYGVNCRFCEDAQLGLAHTRKRAEAVLRSMKWVKRRGRWFCDDECAERQSEADRVARELSKGRTAR